MRRAISVLRGVLGLTRVFIVLKLYTNIGQKQYNLMTKLLYKTWVYIYMKSDLSYR